jgi:hypothetical protein
MSKKTNAVQDWLDSQPGALEPIPFEFDMNYTAGEAMRNGAEVREVDTVPAELMDIFFK